MTTQIANEQCKNDKFVKIIANVVYFVYTMLFFLVQLKIVVDTFFYDKYSLISVVLMLITFKLGEFVNETLKFGNTKLWAIVSIIATSVYITNQLATLVIASFFFFGLSVMKVRDTVVAKSTKQVKFTARTIGFMLAPIVSGWPIIVLMLFAAVLILCCGKQLQPVVGKKILWFKTSENTIPYLCMGIHHFHYFAYAYSIPLIFKTRTEVSAIWIGVLFYVGWAAYNAYERFIKPSWIYLIGGHILATIALLCLPMCTSMLSVSIIWFLTGLGGGTVYMLHAVVFKKTDSQKFEMNIAENIGHIAGILVWSLLIILSNYDYTFYVAAAASILVAFISFFGWRLHRLNHHHQQIDFITTL